MITPTITLLGDKENPRSLSVVGAGKAMLKTLEQVPGFNYVSRDPYNLAKAEGQPIFPPSVSLAGHLMKLGCVPNSDVRKWGAASQQKLKNATQAAIDESKLPWLEGRVELEPFPYQNAGIRFLQEQERTLLCDEMGLGKTMMMLLAASPFLTFGRVLVVTRKYLIPQWITEAKLWLDIDDDQIIDLGSPKNRQDRFREIQQRHGVLVFINWDALIGLESFLHSVRWDWVMADEAHAIKNRKARRTEAFLQLTHPMTTHNLTLATGTPVERSPADMFTLLKAIRPTQFTSYWAFFTTFVDYYTGAGGTDVKGARNSELLHNLIKPFYLRRTRAEKLSHLLEPQIIEFPIPFEPDQAKLYEDILEDAVLYTDPDTGEVFTRELTFGVIIAQFTRLRQAGVCPEVIDPAYANVSNAKADALCALAADLENENILVYTSYRRAAQSFTAALNKQERGCATLYLAGEGTDVISKFGKISDGPRILVTTPDSLGEGTNLQVARVAIFADLPWSGTKYRQAVGRIVRPGQSGQPLVYHLIGPLNLDTKKMHPDSMDHYISKLHKSKTNMFNEVVVMRSFLDQVARRKEGRVEHEHSNTHE